MNFYNDHGQYVTIAPEDRRSGSLTQVYAVTVDGTLIGRITRIQAGEWKYIHTDGTAGYARSSTLAAEALTA